MSVISTVFSGEGDRWQTSSDVLEPAWRPWPALGVGVPRLDAPRLARMAYHACELLCWGVWFRHGHGLYGRVPEGPFVLIANHGGHLDWLVLHQVLRRCLRRKSRFLVKEELLAHRALRLLVRASEGLIVSRAKPSGSVAQAVRFFGGAGGERPILGVFPAGWCRLGTQLPAYPCAASVARRCGLPIVPVALTGFVDVWPPTRGFPELSRRRSLGIHFLPPLDPAGFADDQTATDAAMDAIYAVVRRTRTNAHGSAPADAAAV